MNTTTTYSPLAQAAVASVPRALRQQLLVRNASASPTVLLGAHMQDLETLMFIDCTGLSDSPVCLGYQSIMNLVYTTAGSQAR